MSKTNKGYIHLYMGEHISHTPTILGQCLRASGAGFKIHYINFSDNDYDRLFEQKLDGLKITTFVDDNTLNFDYIFKDYDMLILDNIDHHFDSNNLTNFSQNLIENKPYKLELILCAKSFEQSIIDKADLVSKAISVS